MKIIIPALLLLSIMLSCVVIKSPPLGETNFPLKQLLTMPVNGDIKQIAVSDTWIAVHTQNKIIAIDLNDYKTLWSTDFPVVTSEGSKFQIINDVLVVISENQIMALNKLGQKKVINFKISKDDINILKLVAVYPNYIYVVRGTQRILEAYDISRNVLMWKTVLGPGSSDVFLDSAKNITYVTSSYNAIRALDNSTGTLIWKHEGSVLQGILESGILYVYQELAEQNHYRVAAIDVESQSDLWSKDFTFFSDEGVNKLTVIGNLLLLSGEDLIALNKSGGQQIWRVNVGENFYTSPVEFNKILYAKAGTSRTVYAISPSDGAILGLVKLETVELFDGDDTINGVYVLKDGIVFNTKSSIVFYKSK